MIRSIAIAFLALIVLSSAAQAEKRIALLIGNQSYNAKVGSLKNPHSDVTIVGASLKSLGFQVTIKKDLDYKSLDTELKRFVANVRREGIGAVSFFYYSGHGAADPDTKINYLIPVDVENADDAELWTNSLNLNTLVEGLREQAPGGTHYVVFDACRSELNLTRKGEKALADKGFVPMRYTPGVMVAYATAPGKTASDVGSGAGPYARALAEELLKPGVEAMTMFRNVALRVNREIRQDPWMSSSTLPEMYFAGDATPAKPATTTEPQSTEVERAWALIQDSKDLRDFEAFRRQYGKTNAFYDAQAEKRIDELKRAAAEAKARGEEEARRRREERAAEEKRAAEEARQNAEAAAAKRKLEKEAEGKAQAEAEAKRRAELDAKRQAIPSEAERAWAAIKDTTDQSVLEVYIKQHGGTVYGALARAQLAQLRRQSAARIEAEAQLKNAEAIAKKAQAEAEAKRRREESAAAEKRAAEEAKQLAEADAAKKRAEKAAVTIQNCNQQQDNDRSIRACADLIREYPQNTNAYINRGNAYGRKKDYELAIADYTKAIEIDPKLAGAYHNRGLVYLAKKDNQRAIAEFQTALSLDPSMQSSKDILERIEKARLASLTPPPSSSGSMGPLDGRVTFTFMNTTGSIIHLKVFAPQYNWVWPSADKVFVLNERTSQGQSVHLNCKIGSQICYGGAKPDNTNQHWGAGLDGKQYCTGCCLTCGRPRDNTRHAWTLTP